MIGLTTKRRNDRRDEHKRKLRESMKGRGSDTAPNGAYVNRHPVVKGQRARDTVKRDKTKRGARKSLNTQLRVAEKGEFDLSIPLIDVPLMSISTR